MSSDYDFSTMAGSLEAAIDVEREAYRLVEIAQASKDDAIIAVRISAYNKARDGRMAAEESVQKILKEREVLVPMDSVRGMLRKVILPLLTRLRSIPKREAIRVSPTDDVHAESVLSAAIEDAIAEVRLEFAS